ncbi:DUF3445 domain-containing protein [Sinorhizobium sp. BG8]|uniref:heme-dependent oxidative N-demethylase family protein n=1 Tax=Sinorhizobium sp. BG8 TaxID=2613773 RepID=UPI00193CEF4E|nr:DUF3445 domain-containing protein [Sinorhizobium sp. BG8]QRM56658.1 DUF3445 domain-containing protein [Sinorhizobium sp. BG8]
MITPAYTPYDGSARLFTIGVAPLDPARWIEPDDDMERYLAEKDRVLAAHRSQVFVEEEDTRGVQAEVLSLLAGHLPRHHPGLYRRWENAIAFGDRVVRLDDPDVPPLVSAGSLVQDDLVIMRRRETGWHLVAGYVSFPSSWSLPEKFGRRMEDIHRPVPGFGEATRNAQLINRIFDNLRPEQPVLRFNWSINPDADLYYPVSKAHGALPAGHELRLDNTFVRVERQTLRRLPLSGDILFTIRIYTDPVSAIGTLPDVAAAAATFADQLEQLSPPQAEYKGLTARRARLVEQLRALASG